MSEIGVRRHGAVSELRARIRTHYAADEADVLHRLVERIKLSEDDRSRVAATGAKYVERVRKETSPTMMEAFLAEYGLSTTEGVGLMCLAEALLRVPDAETIDELIHDKIEPSDWGAHLGQSSSSLINASTWALMLTGQGAWTEDRRAASCAGAAFEVSAAAWRTGGPHRGRPGRCARSSDAQFVLGRDH